MTIVILICSTYQVANKDVSWIESYLKFQSQKALVPVIDSPKNPTFCHFIY